MTNIIFSHNNNILEHNDLVFLRTIDSKGYLMTDPHGNTCIETPNQGENSQDMVRFYTWVVLSKKNPNSKKPLTIFDEIVLKSTFGISNYFYFDFNNLF